MASFLQRFCPIHLQDNSLSKQVALSHHLHPPQSQWKPRLTLATWKKKKNSDLSAHEVMRNPVLVYLKKRLDMNCSTMKNKAAAVFLAAAAEHRCCYLKMEEEEEEELHHT
jgi:hypothetical protein